MAAAEHDCKHESVAIKAYEKVMKEKHINIHAKLVVHLLIKNIAGCMPHLTFFVFILYMVAAVRGLRR